MNKEIKSLVNITHKNCMDGLFSSIVVQHYCNLNSIELSVYEMQYGDRIPDLVNKDIIMTDFSFKRDVMETFIANNKSVTVVDHHTTAKDELAGLDNCTFDMEHSGCVLTWKHLFPDEEVPVILKFVEDRDIWNWKLEDSKEFSAGLPLMNFEYTDTFLLLLDKSGIISIIEKGSTILEYQDTIITRKIRSIKEENFITIDGDRILCINNNNLISEVGNEFSKLTEQKSAVQYFITDKDIVFSLRSIDDVDVSKIAKAFGGGGHKKSAGFNIPLKDFKYEKFFIDKRLESLDYKELKITSINYITDNNFDIYINENHLNSNFTRNVKDIKSSEILQYDVYITNYGMSSVYYDIIYGEYIYELTFDRINDILDDIGKSIIDFHMLCDGDGILNNLKDKYLI